MPEDKRVVDLLDFCELPKVKEFGIIFSWEYMKIATFAFASEVGIAMEGKTRKLKGTESEVLMVSQVLKAEKLF